MPPPFRGLLLLLLLAGGTARAEQSVRVFAAASLTNALEEVATQWQRAGHPRPSLAFGATSTLARQIEAGAPADVFVAADRPWLAYLAQRDRLVPGTRHDLLGNALVLVAPRGRGRRVVLQPGFDFAGAFDGKLCLAQPDIVPAGIYARQALTRLGWWRALQGRLVGTDDVRAALAFVERGECSAGIVYATDARRSARIEVLARFPAQLHAPIVYPLAAVRGARPEALAFLRHLRSPAAAAVFRRHGFIVLADAPPAPPGGRPRSGQARGDAPSARRGPPPAPALPANEPGRRT